MNQLFKIVPHIRDKFLFFRAPSTDEISQLRIWEFMPRGTIALVLPNNITDDPAMMRVLIGEEIGYIWINRVTLNVVIP